MFSILFVDDEPLVLRSLRRAVSAREPTWDLHFAESGEEALEILAGTPVDVIVSDMRMPGLDGAALLARVQELHPDVVRIVLSGHGSAKLVFRSVPVAHQFLTKPFDAALLASSLSHALELRALIGSATLRALVGEEGRLPAAPKAYTSLTGLLARENASLSDVVALVERDVELTARISQLASSACFRVPRSVTTLSGYVEHLGVEVLKALVLAVEIVEMFRMPAGGDASISVDEFERHSTSVAALTRALVVPRESGDDALLTGLLHDVGKLVLASRAPADFANAASRARRQAVPLVVAEAEVFGATHAEVGAYLLGIWGLPSAVVRAVLGHHRPGASTGRTLDVTAALYAANLLARDPDVPIGEGPAPVMDAGFVARFDAPALASWRKTVRELFRGAS